MPNLHPKVSVIMNCLNGERHLKESIDCVLAQSFTDFEIVFWDNCSTDNSAAIAMAAGDKLRYFKGQSIVPLGAGRNLAIREARGELIAFLDCDDLWTKDKLERQVPLFDNPKVGLVTSDTVVFDERRELRRVFATARPARGMVFADLIERQWISMSSAVVRREALASLVPNPSDWNGGWFDERLNVCEEADVFYRIAHDWELDYVDSPCTRWRVHGGNTTLRKFGQFSKETRLILEKHRDIYPGYDKDYPRIVELLCKRADFEEAVALWQKGKGAEARKILEPWKNAGRKFTAFRLASYLPSCLFDLAAKVYFALPRFFR